jgi:hypothetical protein
MRGSEFGGAGKVDLMSYRIIEESLWTDPEVRALSPGDKFLFLYLITNPHTHYSGIYYLPFPTIEFETGLSKKAISMGLESLRHGMMIHIEEEKSLVFVKNMFKHQMKHGNKVNMVKGLGAHFKLLHNSRLINEFLDIYKESIDGMGIPFEWDGYPMGGRRKKEQEQEQEQEQEEGGETRESLVPHQEIISAYHETLPELPHIKEWTDARKKALQARWREKTERQNLGWWRSFFTRIRDSDFLMGRVKDFRADLPWIIKLENFVKILEGKYHGTGGNSGSGSNGQFKNRGKYAGIGVTAEADD